jgi:hypothetical protein
MTKRLSRKDSQAKRVELTLAGEPHGVCSRCGRPVTATDYDQHLVELETGTERFGMYSSLGRRYVQRRVSFCQRHNKEVREFLGKGTWRVYG